MKKFYVVQEVVYDWQTNVGPITLSWHDGMVGVLPAFSNKAKAEKYMKSKKRKSRLLVFNIVENDS